MTIKDVTPYSDNAKKHPQKQIDDLARIVKEVGWRQPVLVNQKGVIVVGHGRFETWKQNEATLKPIWVIDDMGHTIHGEPETSPLTEAQEIAYRIADNRLNESDWIPASLEYGLTKLEELGFDMTMTGFPEDYLKTPEDIDVDTSDDELEAFMNSTIKQIVLYFGAEEFDALVPRLEAHRDELGLDDNSALFMHLLEHYEGISDS